MNEHLERLAEQYHTARAQYPNADAAQLTEVIMPRLPGDVVIGLAADRAGDFGELVGSMDGMAEDAVLNFVLEHLQGA